MVRKRSKGAESSPTEMQTVTAGVTLSVTDETATYYLNAVESGSRPLSSPFFSERSP
jgi:hypothetical protein